MTLGDAGRRSRVKAITCGIFCIGLGLAAAAPADEGIGFGLARKYCLGSICLGDAAGAHPELKVGAVFADIKPIQVPVCFSSTFTTPMHDFGNGSMGQFVIQNDPARPDPDVAKYYRIQAIHIRFDPPLTADGATRIEQDVVNRYGMRKSSYRTFYLDDGKRKINFTDNGSANFNLSVTGIERPEYQAQPGCIRKAPSL